MFPHCKRTHVPETWAELNVDSQPYWNKSDATHQQVICTAITDPYALHGLHLNEASHGFNGPEAAFYGAALPKHTL